MIRVTVELVPYGFGKPVTLARAEIANIGGSHDYGNYDVTCFGGGAFSDDADKPMVRGRVTGFARLERNALDLVAMALRAAGFGR